MENFKLRQIVRESIRNNIDGKVKKAVLVENVKKRLFKEMYERQQGKKIFNELLNEAKILTSIHGSKSSKTNQLQEVWQLVALGLTATGAYELADWAAGGRITNGVKSIANKTKNLMFGAPAPGVTNPPVTSTLRNQNWFQKFAGKVAGKGKNVWNAAKTWMGIST